MMIPWRALNGTHQCTEQCKRGANIKRRRLSEEEEREVTSRVVSAYGCLLEMVNSFQYLARVILLVNKDWLAVVRNFSGRGRCGRGLQEPSSGRGRSRGCLGYFLKPWYRGCCYLAWRPGRSPPVWEGPWGGFQDQVEKQMTRRLPRHKTDRKWTYNSAATARKEAGFQTMEEYI